MPRDRVNQAVRRRALVTSVTVALACVIGVTVFAGSASATQANPSTK